MEIKFNKLKWDNKNADIIKDIKNAIKIIKANSKQESKIIYFILPNTLYESAKKHKKHLKKAGYTLKGNILYKEL